MFVARSVAAAFSVVAGADFCCATKLRNKSLQQKSGVSSALQLTRMLLSTSTDSWLEEAPMTYVCKTFKTSAEDTESRCDKAVLDNKV